MRRRSVLGTVSAVAAIPFFGLLGRAASAAGSKPMGGGLPRFVVVDTRFARAKEVAAGLSAGATSVLESSGDVTGIWYRRLEPAWRSAQVAVEGVTTPAALFCLGELARDHRLRVVRYAVVDQTGPTLIHWLILPRSNPV